MYRNFKKESNLEEKTVAATEKVFFKKRCL